MKKILLATLAVTPLLGGVTFANTAHGNTDRGNFGPHILYLGDHAVAAGGTQQELQTLNDELQSQWAGARPSAAQNTSAKPAS